MNKHTVVIVEDNPILGEIFVEAITELGLDTLVVTDGLAAFPKIVEGMPAIVILDLHLPRRSGIEIMQSIRDDENLTATKIIVITADLIRAEQVRDKVDYVLPKPVSIVHLQKIVAQAID